MSCSMSSTRMAPEPPTAAFQSLCLGGLEGDEPARRVIEEQDEAIAARSGHPRLSIKQLTRSKR
jgi:hypothetical protein